VAGDRITEACDGLTPSRSLRKAKSLGFVPDRTTAAPDTSCLGAAFARAQEAVRALFLGPPPEGAWAAAGAAKPSD
jgi:hypothetical protein